MAVPRSMADGAVFSSMSPIRSARSSLLPGAVTLFVFLAAAAGARVVPSDLGLLAFHRLDRVVAAGARRLRLRRGEGIAGRRLRFRQGGCRAAPGEAALQRRARVVHDERRSARRRTAHLY